MRTGGWIQTYTGRQFWPLDPNVEDVDIVDIAHSLSMTCRYGGHVHQFYSVAEHCVLMSKAVAPEYATQAFMHDAGEAYLVDVPRPIKGNIPGFRDMENLILAVIFHKYDVLPWSMEELLAPAVKDADTRILLTERKVLLPNTRYPWEIEHLTPLPVTVTGWPPVIAKRRYLERATELGIIK